MKSRRVPGAIVNISSLSGIVALHEHAVYCASKGGLDQLTRVMALELGPYNIRVNSVNPTVTNTSMGRAVWNQFPAKAEAMRAKIPLGRFAGKLPGSNAWWDCSETQDVEMLADDWPSW